MKYRVLRLKAQDMDGTPYSGHREKRKWYGWFYVSDNHFGEIGVQGLAYAHAVAKMLNLARSMETKKEA